MSYVYLSVRVDLRDHTFVQTPHQAKCMVQQILERDPRWSTCDMEVTLPQGRRPILTQEDVNAWNRTVPQHEDVVDDEYISEKRHNIFRHLEG